MVTAGKRVSTPKRRGRRALLWSAGAIALLISLALGLGACMGAAPTREEISKHFEGRPLPVDRYWQALGRSMHAVEVGDRTHPMVVFVHGTPGEWEAFIGFLADPDLSARFHLVSVDRAGFGESGYGDLETSLGKQAALLAAVFDWNHSGRGAILVGHSLGGAVIARMAMDFPDKVGGLVIVAGSISPDLERRTWYQRLGMIPPIRWLVPKDLDLANREMIPLKKELAAMLPRWREVRVPVTVIQGAEDNLVPPGEADFAEKVLAPPQLKVERIPQMNHFIPWRRPDLMRDAILDEASKLDAISSYAGGSTASAPPG